MNVTVGAGRELAQAPFVGAVARHEQRHARAARGGDRRVESLLLHEPAGGQRVACPDRRATAVANAGARDEVR